MPRCTVLHAGQKLAQLSRLLRKIEHLCQQGNHQQALTQATSLLDVSAKSFHLLRKYIDKILIN